MLYISWSLLDCPIVYSMILLRLLQVIVQVGFTGLQVENSHWLIRSDNNRCLLMVNAIYRS